MRITRIYCAPEAHQPLAENSEAARLFFMLRECITFGSKMEVKFFILDSDRAARP